MLTHIFTSKLKGKPKRRNSKIAVDPVNEETFLSMYSSNTNLEEEKELFLQGN